jgi:hypothetical protein
MSNDPMAKKPDLSSKELEKLRGELVVILPIFLFSLYILIGSFQFKPGARDVPMLIGLLTVILSGMRLFHIIFPASKIGRFKEAGLAGEFDSKRAKIKAEVLKEYEEESSQEITFRDEWKAFIGLAWCFAAFLLLGYIVGTFFAIAGSYYFYGLRKTRDLLITLISMYLIIYLLLYKLLEAPADYGLVLEPILILLGFI